MTPPVARRARVRRTGTLAILSGLILTSAPLLAQTDDAAAERLRELDALRNRQYPGFVSGTSDAVPTTPRPDPTPTPEATDSIVPADGPIAVPTPVPTPLPDYRAPIVLSGDLLTSQTWYATRRRLEPGIEEVRMAMLSNASVSEVSNLYEKAMRDFRLVLAMASIQAPSQEESLALYLDRIERQFSLIVEDYRYDRPRQLENTDQLLRISMDSFRYLLEESDIDRGIEPQQQTSLPSDWKVEDGFQDRGFARTIQGWSGRKLASAFEDRRSRMERLLRRDREFDDPYVAVEMGELARELATRVHEVPVSAETTFRNSALRLDVLSQNLFDYMGESNRPYALRQLRHMRHTREEIDVFLGMAE